MQLTADDVGYVEDSVFNVWKNLGLGALLAMAIMFVFLRSIRTTALGVVGIPICTIAAFLGLLLAGRTINVISLAGVAFAIGMTLDNSIVVLESIVLERRRGLKPLPAAVAGVQKVWPAVLASTLTTVMVFLPVIFIVEEAGQLYSDVAVAISASILASMLVAVTVIPAASVRLLGTDTRSDARHNSDQSPPWQTWVTDRIGWLMATTRRRCITIVTAFAISIAIVVLLTPEAEYLPEGEEARAFAFMTPPPGYNMATMEDIGLELQQYFTPHLGADPDDFAGGQSDVPALKFFNLFIAAQELMIITESTNPGHIDALTGILAERYESYPGMRAFVTRGSIISSNDGGTRSVNLDISGAELADLFAVARAAYARAEVVFDNPSIQTRPGSLSLGQPLLEIRPDWKRASELGLSTEGIGFSVAALTDGAFTSEFFMADDKVDIYLYSQQGPDADVAALGESLSTCQSMARCPCPILPERSKLWIPAVSAGLMAGAR
nr:efflux RND transporter permease subunit [Kineobactrum salinum]